MFASPILHSQVSDRTLAITFPINRYFLHKTHSATQISRIVARSHSTALYNFAVFCIFASKTTKSIYALSSSPCNKTQLYRILQKFTQLTFVMEENAKQNRQDAHNILKKWKKRYKILAEHHPEFICNLNVVPSGSA